MSCYINHWKLVWSPIMHIILVVCILDKFLSSYMDSLSSWEIVPYFLTLFSSSLLQLSTCEDLFWFGSEIVPESFHFYFRIDFLWQNKYLSYEPPWSHSRVRNLSYYSCCRRSVSVWHLWEYHVVKRRWLLLHRCPTCHTLVQDLRRSHFSHQ